MLSTDGLEYEDPVDAREELESQSYVVVGIELVHGVRDVLGDLVVVGFFGWGGSGCCAVYLGGEGGDVWGVERGASVTGGGWWAGVRYSIMRGELAAEAEAVVWADWLLYSV